MRPALALALVWLGLTAAGPRPFQPPPPDLAPLVPFVAAPLDKPPVTADAPLPPTPAELPPLPPAALVLPAADKPAAFVHPPRTLPCIGAWTGVASESLECGRARFQRNEYEEAARALESATRPGTDRDVLREARYWLGEAYYRLRRFEQADWLFRQVAQDGLRQEWGVWALHSSGWTALRVGDATRAREAFAGVLNGAAPAPIEAWARHGLGLAAYALGRHEEAEQAWALLRQRGVPPALVRDVLFWHGEALGRVGRAGQAAAELRRFLEGGAHPLVPAGQLRRAWWTLAAGQGAEALAAFRSYLAQPPSVISREWGEAGLGLAQLTTGDWAGARATAASLNAQRSTLALPLLLRLLRAALDSPTTADADTIAQDLLASSLTPPVRGWVLLVKGEVDRARGNRDEARTQFELARQVAGATPVGWQGMFRLARTNFELREFRQALADLHPLASAPAPPELRLAALILEGEAAYHAGDHAVSGAAFRRALLEFPQAPEMPMVRLASAWSSLRQGRADVAYREFLDFARSAPDNPHGVDALVLASELAITAGDLQGARGLLDRIVLQTYPMHPRSDFARLNRGILLVRMGDAAGARAAFVDWLGRAPFPALFGRAHAGHAAALLASGDVTGAERALALARREGLGAFASLGTGVVALRRSRWDDAARAFAEARDAGTPDVVAAAEYGLAVAGFHKGAMREFAKPAQAALAALPPGPRSAGRAGELLYALTGIALEAKDWPGALASARRIVTEHPAHDAADDGLERVAAAAADAKVWPVAYEADVLLRQRFPQSPFVAAGRARVGEALLETGRMEEARRELEQAAVDVPTTRTTMLLARVREAAGARPGALEAYARAAREGAGAEWSTPALFGHARLLVQERRWDQARSVLGRLLKNDDLAVATEAAQAIGDTYAGEGDALAAAEYYLTAAYAAPTSSHGRRGLLAAARAFASLKQKEAAERAYRTLLAQADLPADLAAAARQGLSALGR